MSHQLTAFYRAIFWLVCYCFFFSKIISAQPGVTASFNIPDTVCINTPVEITNTSIGATSHYWNFCVADLNQTPIGANLGNLGGQFSMPVFMDYVYVNGNYYGFLINFNPGKLVRLNFGNSLLNIPTATNLGDFSGIMPLLVEGIQMVQNEGKWYAIIVAGFTGQGLSPRLIKIDFGADITNVTPIATNWGNLGNMQQPIDLHVFQESGNWYGFTVNAENNTITRFNFTNSFDNTPTAVNLGNIGNLAYPTGIYAINDNNFWRVFVVNGGNNSRTGGTWSLTRLDFGSSLLNTPVGVNLGNPGNLLKHPRDLTILKSCGQTTGFAVNGAIGSSDIVRIDFGSNLTAVPALTSLGNIGNLNFPHSIARIFRVGADLYSFVTNVGNNSLTRLRFSGCNSSNIPNSSLQNPPSITYTIPGTYNINLTIDDGLPTQTSICKAVVVLPELEHKPTQKLNGCNGNLKIGSSSKLGTYLWSTGATSDSITVTASGTYWVETNRFGCTNRDSFIVTIIPPFQVDLGADKNICEGSSTLLDAGITGDSYLWNTGSITKTITASSAGTFYVTVTRNTCKATDTIKVNEVATPDFDFSYKQGVCDPYSVQFSSIGGIVGSTYWDFGDGNSSYSSAITTHTYTTTGNYLVKFAIGNGICSDTVAKTISINITNENLISTPDTTICFGSSKQLRTTPSLSFCWWPTTFLDNPTSPNPTTSTTQDITYFFTAQTTGQNLIVNGNFSQGNSGFTSGYSYTATNLTEGQYYVGPDPSAWNTSLSKCGDHTSGNGNMMMINGSPVADVNVWRQIVAVQPNTNYAFSTWIQALWPPNPAQLQFSINGQTTGVMITASLPTCTWRQFYTTWNSGNNTTAIISIVNKNTQVQGNDFALDDISFAEVFIKRDSVEIKVEKPKVTAGNDTIICTGKSVQLTASGSQKYNWAPAVGLSNAAVANPLATPAGGTQYIVTGTSANGCVAKDTVMVTFFAKSNVVVSSDTMICKSSSVGLSATGGVTYNWSPVGTLNDPFSRTPIAYPLENTKYYVSVKDINSCEYTDSVIVTLRPEAVFSINGPQSTCTFDSVQLNASGGQLYNWHNIPGLNSYTIADPIAVPTETTDFTVTVTDTICNESAILTTRITALPLPNVKATKANDIDCRNSGSQLNVTGTGTGFEWISSPTLSSTSIKDPIATPTVTTSYIVKGTDPNGCSAYDTIAVIVYPQPAISISADTMICKNSSAPLSVSGGVTYSWAPANFLSDPFSSNPIANPVTDTRYYVTVTDAIACEYIDSVDILIKPPPLFEVINDVNVCKGDSIQLSASGGDKYIWTPTLGLSDPSIANPIAFPGDTRDYTVTITESVCHQSSTFTTKVAVLAGPVISATKSNDIDCSQENAQLSAIGASHYVWFPSVTLNNPGISNPIASPDVSTEYIVMGTDPNGCTGYDTILVKVEHVNRSQYLMPNAFSPNNDGLNDCFRIKYWGIVNEFEFSIYNRWGERLFLTKDPNRCWDGTYKGVLQDGGVYIYMIKAKTFCQPEVFKKGTFLLVR